jgi:hypothetical protein
MKITCHHPSSTYGIPVILSDAGEPMDYAPGLTATLARIGWSRAQFAERCGYKSARSVEKFWQGVQPPAATLNQLAVALDQAP